MRARRSAAARQARWRGLLALLAKSSFLQRAMHLRGRAALPLREVATSDARVPSRPSGRNFDATKRRVACNAAGFAAINAPARQAELKLVAVDPSAPYVAAPDKRGHRPRDVRYLARVHPLELCRPAAAATRHVGTDPGCQRGRAAGGLRLAVKDQTQGGTGPAHPQPDRRRPPRKRRRCARRGTGRWRWRN